MKLIWLTDIHLNFLEQDGRMNFYKKIIEASGDKILISGDIAEAPSVSETLKEMAQAIQKPIYFVLGNHDYYRGQIDSVRKEIKNLCKHQHLLHWLPASGVQDLGNQTLLLGEDCWADGRYGDYANSLVCLNDSRMIVDLMQSSLLGKYPLLKKMQALADRDARRLKIALVHGIKNFHPKKVIILIHVPPFKEACLHEGQIGGEDYIPYFSSKAAGDVLLHVAQENPGIDFLVLCGHTHNKAALHPCPNLTVRVGMAEYTKPDIQEVITLQAKMRP